MTIPPYLYHTTSAANLAAIARSGLVPSQNPHWGGDLGDRSFGKVFASRTPKGALYYAKLRVRQDMADRGRAGFPLLLRIVTERKQKWVRDRSTQQDYFTEQPIPPERIRILWQEAWRPLGWGAEHLQELDYFRTDKGIEDFEGNIVGQADLHAAADVGKTYKSWGIVNPPLNAAFWRWFGDSRVVDENGQPLAVYHGTRSEFDTFDLDKAGTNNDTGMWGTGFYFSPDRKMSRGYGNKMKRVYLSLQSPLVLRAIGENWPEIVNQPYKQHETHGEAGRQWSNAMRDKLIAAGYDGVMQYERVFTGRMVMPSEKLSQVVAFFPTQIKSIYNVGTWDPGDPDIRRNPDEDEEGGGIAFWITPAGEYIDAERGTHDDAVFEARHKFGLFESGYPCGAVEMLAVRNGGARVMADYEAGEWIWGAEIQWLSNSEMLHHLARILTEYYSQYAQDQYTLRLFEAATSREKVITVGMLRRSYL